METIAKTPTIIFNTSGTGLWSGDIKPVTITDMRIGYVDDELNAKGEAEYGELRVYFDVTTWNVQDSGLIYTDRKWLKELQQFLDSHGLAGADVSYSEQGMQGDDYVSLDVGRHFLKAWATKFNVDWHAVIEKMHLDSVAQWEALIKG
jgi:hypothetical protein